MMAASEAAAAAKALPPSALSNPGPSGGKPTAAVAKAVGPLNILAYLLGLPVLGYGVWLLSTRDYGCEEFLGMPRIRAAIGVGLLLLFVVHSFVVYYGRTVLMPGHMLLSAALVIMLTLGLALVGTYKAAARGMPATPMWLRARVTRPQAWRDVRTCLYNEGICADLAYRTVKLTAYDFGMAKLSPVESGCCKPPALCGMEYVNATYWNAAAAVKDGAGNRAVGDSVILPSFSDCRMWSNEPNLLCYDCRSCKMGFLKAVSYRWKRVGVFLFVMSVLFMTVHIIRFTLMLFER